MFEKTYEYVLIILFSLSFILTYGQRNQIIHCEYACLFIIAKVAHPSMLAGNPLLRDQYFGI